MAIKTLDDLVDAVQADRTDLAKLSKFAIKEVIKTATALIQEQTAAGDSVRIHNFGTFAVKTRAARTGRNPQTGEAIQIPETSVLAFKHTKHGK